MDKKRININYFYNLSYQIFVLIVPVILTPYISRVLGAEKIGVYSFSYSIVSYFTIFAALGTGTYGVKKIGENSDKSDRSTQFFNIFFFRLFTSIIATIVYMLYVIFISNNKLISFLQGFYILGVMFDIVWFYQGTEEYKNITIKNFIFKIISVIFIFIFVKEKDDLPFYVLGLSLFNLLGNLSMWINIRKQIDFKEIKNCKPFNNIKDILLMFFPTIAIQLYSVIDKTLIGTLITEKIYITESIIVDGYVQNIERIVELSNIENGYFEQAEKIVTMSFMIIVSMGYAKVPQIASSYKQGDINSVKEHLKNSFQFVWLLAIPMTLGILGISDFFSDLFFGDGYDKIPLLLRILSLFFIFMGINNVVGVQFFVSTGKYKTYSKLLIVTGVINIGGCFLFIPNFLSAGACLASIISEFCLAIISIIYIIKNDILTSKEVFLNVWKKAIAGLMMLVTILILKNIFYNSWIGLVMLIFCGGCLYGSVLVILKDSSVYSVVLLIKNKIFKHKK